MKIREGFVVREVGGKTIAVASGELSRHFNGMITLNGTGKLLFGMLEEGTTEEDMSKKLIAVYGIGEEQAKNDVRSFLSGFEKAGLLIP